MTHLALGEEIVLFLRGGWSGGLGREELQTEFILFE